MKISTRRQARTIVETDLLLGVGFLPKNAGLRCEVASESVVAESKAAPDAESGSSENLGAREQTSLLRMPVTEPSAKVRLPRIGPDTLLDRVKSLAELKALHDSACGLCAGPGSWTQTVFGEGNPHARLMFVGEAPGEEEDRTGRPFVGRAGQKLDEIIKAMQLSRQEVYIANILKTRPPGNRTPLEHEVTACAPYLMQQVRIIRPLVLVALGGPATKFLLNTSTGITQLRGRWAEYVDDEEGLRIPLMPTFHPAYLLRNYTRDTREKVWSDMQAVLAKLK